MVREVEVDILTPRRLLSREDGEDVLNLLCSFPSLMPEKWNTYEPIRTAFDPADYGSVLDTWGDVFLWKRRRPKTEGFVWSAWSVRDKTGSMRVTVDAAKADVYSLRLLLEQSATRFRPHFAYIHMLTERDIPIGRLTGTVGCLDPQRQRYHLGVTGWELERNIPDLYWVTVFGAPYVKLFGKERVLSAPAYAVREIGGGCVYLQLSESIFDLETDYEIVNGVRQAVKKHLDCDAFFDPGVTEDHVYNVPELKLEPIPDQDSLSSVARHHLEEVERFQQMRRAKP